MEEKNRLAATRWRALPEEEKKKFEEVAKKYKHPDVADWSQEERNKFIARHRRQLLAEIMLLEDLGCHSSMMLVDPCGELFNLGSAEGVNFLITNHDVVAKFRQHFYVQCKRYTYRHVQSLFNKKYSEAIAKPGSRVPYLRVTTRNENDNPPESNTSYTITLSTIADDSTIASTLRKVASEANIEDVISKTGKQLEEDDIDVEDCSLTQDERLTLYTHCRDFFDEDAWTAVCHNSKDISNSAKDIIFPLYTEAADEDFWLFYCPGKTLSSIDNARPTTKLGGYWLDRKDTSNAYTILTPEKEIKVKWIIKTDHGPLYYEQSLDVNANGEEFELPGIFKDCIRLTLHKSGFFKGLGLKRIHI
ncbi:hypothetical protein OS493_035427 [Desmophyllum pertusum]|uniref:Uncharacterized protein n=1 Tax=Desmophyllum pertusum TaxID=174260 RepID=A0A9W9ZIM6_9CNID|nr:hypothetical protein OS493_035427 [Desmophyllum pertusum]